MNQNILQEVEDYKKQLKEQASPDELLKIIIQLRKLTSKEHNPPLQEIIHSKVCEQLIAIMENSTSCDILMETLWILTNVCSGNAAQTKYIIEIGGVVQFLKYVGHENEDVMAQALWGLGNIAGDSSTNRDLVLKLGAVTIVLKQLERKNLKISNQRTIVWVISNFCRGKPLPKYDVVRPCMFYLGKAIDSFQDDQEIISDSLWGINYLTESATAIEDLINYGILQKICNKYFQIQMNNILTPAMRIIGNVATSNDSHVDFLLQQNILKPLITLFAHHKKCYRKESLWTISNIMAGTQEQVKKVLQIPDFFENLIGNRNDSMDVRKEMYFVISNSLNISDACQFFLDKNIISIFLEDIINVDANLQAVIIEGLELLIKYINKSKKIYPELDGKLEYLKEQVKPAIASVNRSKFKSVYKCFVTYFKKQEPVDSLNKDLDALSLENKQKKKDEQDNSSEIDDEDDDDDYEDDDEDDNEDEDDEDDDEEEDDEEIIKKEITNNSSSKNNKTKPIINNKGANAQISVKHQFNFNQVDQEQNIVMEEPIDVNAAAAPPNIDYQQFYFTDEQQQAFAGGAAAPGP